MDVFDVAGEDIAVDSDEVGGLARFDGDGFLGDAQGFGGLAGKRGHGLGQGDCLIDVARAIAVISIGPVGSGVVVGCLAIDHTFDSEPGV